MATNQDIALRSSMNTIVAQEREHNLFKTKLQKILTAPMSAEMKRQLSEKGLHFVNGDIADVVNAALVFQAMQGNVAAFTTIRDTMGFKPVDQVRNDVVIKIDMNPRAKELGD